MCVHSSRSGALVLTVSQKAAAKGLDTHPAVEKYIKKKAPALCSTTCSQDSVCAGRGETDRADTFCNASMVIVLMHSFVKPPQCFDSPPLTLLGFDVQAPCCVSYMTVI